MQVYREIGIRQPRRLKNYYERLSIYIHKYMNSVQIVVLRVRVHMNLS